MVGFVKGGDVMKNSVLATINTDDDVIIIFKHENSENDTEKYYSIYYSNGDFSVADSNLKFLLNDLAENLWSK